MAEGCDMDWVLRRLKERASRTEDQRLLGQATRDMWPELLHACQSAVDFYDQSMPGRPPIIRKINGSDYCVFARMEYPVSGPPTEPASVRVSVNFDKAEIFVDHGRTPSMPTFQIVLDSGGAKFDLMCEGRTIDYEKAAERILDPLIFSDLPQRYPSHGKLAETEGLHGEK